MNYRDYKEFAPEEIYHIFNRGVGKIEIFRESEDYEVFLSRLKENLFPEFIKKTDTRSYRRKTLPPGAFDLISFCLMPNHFHLLIQQNTELSISQLILKVCTSYSKYFNKKYERVGSLFQDQFKAVPVRKNKQLLWLSYYIHNNPKKAQIAKGLQDYKWSSLQDYIKSIDGICRKDIILGQFKSNQTYLEYFKNYKNIEKELIGHQDLLLDSE